MSAPRLLAVTAFATLIGAAPCFAQETEPGTTQVEDVVVVGTQSPRDRAETFVDAVTDPPRGRGPARWSRRSAVCVGVVNLRPEVAQAVIDHVSWRAQEIGLEVGEPGCDPNVIIVATDDGQAMARAMVDRSPKSFRPGYSGASKSRLQLTRFVEIDRPIRWWHVSMPVDADSETPAVRMPGGSPPLIPGSGRLRTQVRQIMMRAYVIVDLDQTEDLSFVQLADYVAMVSFAQIDPDADVRQFATILNVVHDPSSVDELTDWDHAYLSAMYGAEGNQRNARSQLSSVAGAMHHDRRRAAASEPE